MLPPILSKNRPSFSTNPAYFSEKSCQFAQRPYQFSEKTSHSKLSQKLRHFPQNHGRFSQQSRQISRTKQTYHCLPTSMGDFPNIFGQNQPWVFKSQWQQFLEVPVSPTEIMPDLLKTVAHFPQLSARNLWRISQRIAPNLRKIRKRFLRDPFSIFRMFSFAKAAMCLHKASTREE